MRNAKRLAQTESGLRQAFISCLEMPRQAFRRVVQRYKLTILMLEFYTILTFDNVPLL